MRTKTMLALQILAPMMAVQFAVAGQQPDPKVDEVLKAARAAMGGEAALAKVQSVTVTGSARRVMGEREMTSDVTLDLLLPDKFKRTEDMSFGGPGGPSVTRVTAVNGTDTWDDSTNRGAGGAMRFGGPGGPGGTGGQGQGQGRQFTDEDRQRMRDAQARRLKGELARYSLILFLRTEAPVTYGGVAEAPEGKADVLEVKPEGAPAMKLYVDQATHKPLMLTYDSPLPRFNFRGGPGQGQGQGQAQGQAPAQPPRPTPEEIEKMRSTPPQMATFEVHFSEYKKVEGVMLPYLITQSVNGTVAEEFTIDKYKVNAPLKPEQFVKKGAATNN